MSSYIDVVKTEKKYTGNVVIAITPPVVDSEAIYFSIRQPDSGINIQTPHCKSVMSLTLNPTQIDLRKVNTTISNFSFRILDKDNIITSMVGGDARDLIGAQVRIFLGRSNESMAFSEYFELPITYIQKCERGDNSYVITSAEQTERMARPIFNDFKNALAVDILAATTIWTMRDDISTLPTSGFFKVEDEFVSYSGVDLVNNYLTGVIRGELGSTPADHKADLDCVFVETVTDNPINIILKILTSGGGGSSYDVLNDGLAISSSLIDLTEIEALRDELFSGVQFTVSIYNCDSALKFIENELLMPNGLRFTNSINSKVTLAVLDKAQFVEEPDVINEDTITKYPKWSIDGAKVTNIIEVQWNFNEGTGAFQNRDVYQDTDSIASYGKQTPLKFEFKGIKASLDGQALVDDFGSRLLARIAFPTPEIQITTQIDKSLQTIGNKAYLVSSKIPAPDGTLNFASDLEIVSRSINQSTGDVVFKLAFTSYTTIRSGFIAPSDLITSYISQKKVNVLIGRSAMYSVGWYMRLWDETNQVFCDDPPNKIVGLESDQNNLLTQAGDNFLLQDGSVFQLQQSTSEDSIIFEDDWLTDLSTSQYRIRFAKYDDVAESQKRYGFISETTGLDFPDGKPSYKVTY